MSNQESFAAKFSFQTLPKLTAFSKGLIRDK